MIGYEIKYTIQEGGLLRHWGHVVAEPLYLLESYRDKVIFDELAIPANQKFIELHQHVFVKSVHVFEGDKQLGVYYCDDDTLSYGEKVIIHKGKRI